MSQILKMSNIQIGTAFEHRCRSLLNHQLHMSLIRVGGKGDGGVDLRGWWWLPHSDPDKLDLYRRVRVLVQCKAEKLRVGPKTIREMVGTVGYARDLDDGLGMDEQEDGGKITKDLMAIICSQTGFSKASVLAANTSPTPIMLLHIAQDRTPSPFSPDNSREDTESSGVLLGAVSNPALLGSQGLFRGRMEFRREYQYGMEAAEERFGIGPYWDGKRLRDCRPRSERGE